MTDLQACDLLALLELYVRHYAEDADKMTLRDLMDDLSMSTAGLENTLAVSRQHVASGRGASSR